MIPGTATTHFDDVHAKRPVLCCQVRELRGCSYPSRQLPHLCAKCVGDTHEPFPCAHRTVSRRFFAVVLSCTKQDRVRITDIFAQAPPYEAQQSRAALHCVINNVPRARGVCHILWLRKLFARWLRARSSDPRTAGNCLLSSSSHSYRVSLKSENAIRLRFSCYVNGTAFQPITAGCRNVTDCFFPDTQMFICACYGHIQHVK